MGGRVAITAFLPLHLEGGGSGTFQNRKLGQLGMAPSLALVPYFQL